MPKRATQLDYGRRVERVIRHIALNLDDPLETARLADVACFSPWHFHRIYRAVTGEPVGETVRRMRLHRAAADLLLDERPVEQVRKRAGYGSDAAFNRAFKAMFGIPPVTYRRRGRLVIPDRPEQATEQAMHDVSIVHLDPIHLLTMDHRGLYTEIGSVFDRLTAWAGQRGLVRDTTRFLAIYYDDPAAVPASELRSKAGITIDPDTPGLYQEEVQIVTIPGGRCANLVYQGPYWELEQPYTWLFGEWLPQSGEEAGDEPAFEEYLNDPKTLPPVQWLTSIYLPLQPRPAA